MKKTVTVSKNDNTKSVAKVVKSNNKTVKFTLNQSNGCIDRQRNKLRGDLKKILVEKTYMIKGSKFGELELENKQQVSGLMRSMKSVITSYVNDNTTDFDLNELYGLQNEKTQKSIGAKSNITKQVIIDQHIEYFTTTLNKKVKG